MIESGDRSTNTRDREALLDQFRAIGGVPFIYDWRSKNEPLLWIADAINGAIHAHLVDGDHAWFDQLQTGGVLTQGPVYTVQECGSPGSCPSRTPFRCSSYWHSGTCVFAAEQY